MEVAKMRSPIILERTSMKQYDNFKKCIKWSKSNEAWCGTFAVDKTPGYPGINVSLVALPAMKATAAKAYICENLYNSVVRYCGELRYDLDELIARGLKQKQK